MPKKPPVALSKSRFVAGVLCLKRLYFQIHHPELAEEAGDGQAYRLEQGREVGLMAQTRFPGGVLVRSDTLDIDEAVAKTAALLKNPSVLAVFEATFRYKDIVVRVDILQRRPQDRWRLIEVKSSVDLKDYYLYDAAVQHHVVSGCGLDISSTSLMYLNRDYVYDGLQYDPRELFVIKDITKRVSRLLDEIPKLVRMERKALVRHVPPDIQPGPQCWQPYECEFFGYCNPEPPQNHVSYLPGLREEKREALSDLGVAYIHEIPEEFPLTEMQIRVSNAVKTGRPWVSSALATELAKLRYPLYFMDFESLSPAIPRFAGMRPYAQMPFQWSVYRQQAPGCWPEHSEFLADTDGDPREDFVVSLAKAVGRHGQIVVYNSGFESRRLHDLAEWLPKYRKRVESIRSRLWDLLPFIRTHVYYPGFQGSFSLKAVAPAVVPDMSYAGMEIAHGEEAGLAWDSMVRGGRDAAERERLRSALLTYCRHDTLAMVKIIEALRRLSRGASSSTRMRAASSAGR